MSILDDIKREAAWRDRLSPAARLITDTLDAINRAQSSGVSLEKIETILRDAASDVRDKRAN